MTANYWWGASRSPWGSERDVLDEESTWRPDNVFCGHGMPCNSSFSRVKHHYIHGFNMVLELKMKTKTVYMMYTWKTVYDIQKSHITAHNNTKIHNNHLSSMGVYTTQVGMNHDSWECRTILSNPLEFYGYFSLINYLQGFYLGGWQSINHLSGTHRLLSLYFKQNMKPNRKPFVF